MELSDFRIVQMDIDKLKPYENNPRFNEKAVEAVAKSIENFGFKVPIVVDKFNVIVAGHTRLKAAQKLQLAQVPVIVADDLTPEQIKAFRLADNKVSEIAEWDFTKLEAELSGLDMDMSQFNFDMKELSKEFDKNKEVIEDDFDVDEALKNVEEPTVKRGQVWKLGDHYLMCGDSTSKEDVEKLMSGGGYGLKKADLLITDPPYNVALGMGGSVDDARKRHRRTDGLVIMNDKMENDDFRKFLQSAFSAAKSNMKEGAAFYIWHADNEGYNFRGACIDIGWKIRQTLIWNKNAITLGRQDYQWKHEPCLYGWNEGTHCWYNDRSQSTVLDFNKPSRSEMHPTMKPVELFDYQIKNSTKEGDLVLDLFGGSGTTMIACEQNGRHAYLMELDPKYCDVIIKRWETLTGKQAVKL